MGVEFPPDGQRLENDILGGDWRHPWLARLQRGRCSASATRPPVLFHNLLQSERLQACIPSVGKTDSRWILCPASEPHGRGNDAPVRRQEDQAIKRWPVPYMREHHKKNTLPVRTSFRKLIAPSSLSSWYRP